MTGLGPKGMFPVKVGLVGLGRMARRLTEHAAKSASDFREFMPQAYE